MYEWLAANKRPYRLSGKYLFVGFDFDLFGHPAHRIRVRLGPGLGGLQGVKVGDDQAAGKTRFPRVPRGPAQDRLDWILRFLETRSVTNPTVHG